MKWINRAVINHYFEIKTQPRYKDAGYDIELLSLIYTCYHPFPVEILPLATIQTPNVATSHWLFKDVEDILYYISYDSFDDKFVYKQLDQSLDIPIKDRHKRQVKLSLLAQLNDEQPYGFLNKENILMRKLKGKL